MIRQMPTVVSQAMREAGTPHVFCVTRMRPAFTPALAADYVRELSADVRAVVVLDASGALLAGSEALAGPARALTAASRGSELEVVRPAGVVCAARDEHRALVAVCGRFALPAVVRCDLRAALAALSGHEPGVSPAPGATRPPSGAVEALERAAEGLIAAAQRASEA